MGDAAAIDRFISRWRANEGGAERANYVLFLTELCTLLDLPQPQPADASHTRNDYVFERAVTFKDEAGKSGHGRIDLYKRGAFVLEAKQSREPGGKKEVALPAQQPALPGFAPTEIRGRRSAQRGWDVLMRNAREQAEQYARALPTDHGWPPFIIVADVGHAFEIFADFSGQGKNYRQFPDRSGYRIYLDDLRDEGVRARLRAMWLDPHSLDPAKHAAAVTRDIAKRLAHVSKLLEERGYQPEPVAHFLMRCLFTMFAEDTGLLEPGSFTDVLADARNAPDSFAPMLEDLWRTMDTGGFSPVLRKTVRKFNGGLFAERNAIPLHKEEIGELYEAARHVWTEVEPAIFGTLLEQALDKVERKRLGAHYTPRAYVERLVIATIIEPLQREWETEVLGTVERERSADPQGAIRAVHDFHEKLAATRVLDPACGTGNFLYVALELMKRLEGDVLEVLADLGGQEALALETATVHPRNFLGLELNPRAAAIAELVLWLGYLQWQMRNGGQIADPVLERLSNITAMDAVLKHDAGRMRDDGTFDEFPNPRRPDWPQADYIVGNPPFIGGKDVRARLGDGYATALWKAHPKINKSADFVMYWWDRAAERLTEKGTRLKRFGFVTTNSITQEFSRRVMAARMDARAPISLVMAVPDHPWTKATKDAAAVRIAMTVGEAGGREGSLYEVTHESGLDTDAPRVDLRHVGGDIHADLTVGSDVTQAHPLRANNWICSPGVKLHGPGFIISKAEAEMLGLGRRDGLDRHIRLYRNGRDLMARSRNQMVIDLFGLSEVEVRRSYPEIYQHLMTTVKVDRDKQALKSPTTDALSYASNWWVFGKPRTELRPALEGLPRYIVTVETAKHRVFQFLDASILADNMLVCVASDEAFHLGCLGSKIDLVWTSAQGGTLEDRPRFTKSQCFDPFPFPDATPEQRTIIGDLAEELDATRKEVLAEHTDLTLTGLYNLREKLRQHGPFTPVEQDQRRRGRVDIIAQLHDRIDDAVADAYGWPRDLSDEAIVTRLVALNAERHAEEKAGKVRWLRPDYQLPRAGVTVLAPKAQPEQIEALLPAAATRKPAFPRDAIGQTAAVLADLRGGAGLTSAEIARRYAQGLRSEPRIAATLAALVRLGHVAAEGDRFTLRRAA
ncbi:class I SAM-dependent DNA methyltransferase [Sphingomonas hylomeconis]|uniref:site-specific DNA-methyltransferase (adenine-specific) n=1 Tax=Sphingomonas hylomeconis TaxID=1395958 RepID=A0ABV7SXG4_9SPHN|nr:DNA methyltransferase [Sphingomonas hylomeconis]